MEVEFAPLRSLDAPATNLPLQLTSFIGRDAELKGVSELLREHRFVTLTGAGGIGKTRLATRVAAEALPRFRNGVWLCELAAAEDSEMMLQVVGSTLGVISRPEMSLLESTVDFLRVKQMLIVLDNCEHLLEPVTELIEGVLVGCQAVELLATSREVLSVSGERVVGLRSLSLPGSSSAPEDLLASEAVELFVERARAARSGFEVNVGNAAAIAEICRRLDGVPLAIELAAARVGAMSPSEIASHLDERFRLLRGSRRTALERHHTLRATVDWSYSLLAAAERVVFERIGVFAGGFDADDACAVVMGAGIEEWDVLDALASLVAKSMLIADEDGGDGLTRYQLLETIGAYARERLDHIGESDLWRRRHAEHYAKFSAEAGQALVGSDEVVWRRRLRAERDNVRAAVFWSLDSSTPGDRQFGMAIIASLATEVQGDRTSGYGSWAVRALPFAHEAPPGQRAAVLGCAAFDAFHRGNLDTALTLAEEAMWPGVPADCPCPSLPVVALAASNFQAGRSAQAQTVITTALEHAEAIRQDAFSEAILFGVRSIFRSISGNADGARQDAVESLRSARSLGNPSLLVVALTAAAYVWTADEPQRARDALEETIALAQSGASDVNLPIALTQLALMRLRDGDCAGALDAVRAAVVQHHAGGNRPGLAGTLTTGRDLFIALGHRDNAVVLTCAVAEGCLSSVTNPDTTTQLHALLAEDRQQLGDPVYRMAATQGSALSYEEVVAYALDAIDDIRAELR
jgi:predicted ATPase